MIEEGNQTNQEKPKDTIGGLLWHLIHLGGIHDKTPQVLNEITQIQEKIAKLTEPAK